MGAPGGYGLCRFERRSSWASPSVSPLRAGFARIMFAMLPCAKTTGATAGAVNTAAGVALNLRTLEGHTEYVLAGCALDGGHPPLARAVAAGAQLHHVSCNA